MLIKLFIAIKIKIKSIITLGRQDVASESTPSFDLISPSCNNLWVVKWDIVVPDE